MDAVALLSEFAGSVGCQTKLESRKWMKATTRDADMEALEVPDIEKVEDCPVTGIVIKGTRVTTVVVCNPFRASCCNLALSDTQHCPVTRIKVLPIICLVAEWKLIPHL